MLDQKAQILKSKAIESTSCGVVISDFTQKDNPLIYVNAGFENMTGYSRDEVIGKNCRFLQGDYTDQPQLDIIRHALKSGKDCKVILRNFRKDGTMFYNELCLSPVHDENGKVTNYIGVQTDVTEREISLLESQKGKTNKIAVKDYKEGSVRLLDPYEIFYAERDKRQVVIHTKSEDFPTYLTIEKLYLKLANYGFYKASQSAIVNLNYIEHLIPNGDGTYDIILTGKRSSQITASRAGAKNILADLQI
jgi:PAS domain S-box-containing protein